jgi:hypothetical protein
MKFATTAKCPDCWFSWRVGLLMLAAAAAFVLLIVKTPGRGASKPMVVDIVFNTNGIPTVLGVPLRNAGVRDIVLRTLSRAKVPVRVLQPSGVGGAPGWDTNAVQAFNAIMKAGLIPTNKPSGPSPYE